MSKRIIVVGGGASGMTAAIIAARAGAKVTIIEQNQVLGKKILATGNGRCNFTNLEMNADCYYCKDTGFISRVLEMCPPTMILDFFESVGISMRNKDGYIYPFNEQAVALRDALVFELKYLGIEVILDTAVESIHNNQVKTWNRTFCGDAIILATGGKSGLAKQVKYDGFSLLSDTKHKLTSLSPALVALKGEGKFFKKITGVRTEARITAVVDNIAIRSEVGELQLTDYGVSGIPVFQVSRILSQAIATGVKGTSVIIDFIPQYDAESWGKLLEERSIRLSNRNMKEFLTGIFKDKLVDFLLYTAKINEETLVKDVTKERLEEFARICKTFEIRISESNAFSQSQVTAGGICVSEVHSTLESKYHKSLYFTGEILDVDGICGGYNLHFAWATGIIAASSITRSEEIYDQTKSN